MQPCASSERPWLAEPSNRRERLATRKPAVAIWRRLRLRKATVRELRVAGLLFDAGPVAKGDLVHGVRAPIAVSFNVLAGADRQDSAGAFSGSDDHVPRLGWAMYEVPLPERSFLALDEQECLPGEDKEGLLSG